MTNNIINLQSNANQPTLNIIQSMIAYMAQVSLKTSDIVVFIYNKTDHIQDITVLDTMKNIQPALLLENLNHLDKLHNENKVLLLRKVNFESDYIPAIFNGLDVFHELENQKEKYDFQVIDYLLSDGTAFYSLEKNDLI